eukprot:Transcript_12881.p3 GENE.Transcript_12881~~Transcript_12881.p3  ORF type:complete len:118 (+),score=47.70 Transcript_12881:202-555(+)
MEGCALTAAPMSRLAAALARSHVATLDLGSNEMGDEGVWELAWRLPECRALSTLLLSTNDIEEDGASELLASLTASPNIDYTDLRGNRIPDPSPTIAGLKALGGRTNVAFQRRSYGA